MPRKSTIQNERYCRSRAYGLYSTYSLREYYKGTIREIDRKRPSRDTLGREGEVLQIFKSNLWSPHLGALKPSLTLDLDSGKRKSPKGRGEGEGDERRRRPVNAVKQWKKKRPRWKGYLYPKGPKCPDQVRKPGISGNLFGVSAPSESSE
jgi:hypothetical protein